MADRFYRELLATTRGPQDLLERRTKIQIMQRQQPSYVGTHDAIREWMDEAASEIEQLRSHTAAIRTGG